MYIYDTCAGTPSNMSNAIFAMLFSLWNFYKAVYIYTTLGVFSWRPFCLLESAMCSPDTSQSLITGYRQLGLDT